MSEQLDIFSPSALDVVAENGGRSRSSDPETSKDAARTVKAGTQRSRVLCALAASPNGLNGWEASVAAQIRRPHAATTRLEELEDLGFAERTSSTRPTDTGCQALVWKITSEGRRVASELNREAA